jgi:hypothetical protein
LATTSEQSVIPSMRFFLLCLLVTAGPVIIQGCVGNGAGVDSSPRYGGNDGIPMPGDDGSRTVDDEAGIAVKSSPDSTTRPDVDSPRDAPLQETKAVSGTGGIFGTGGTKGSGGTGSGGTVASGGSDGKGGIMGYGGTTCSGGSGGFGGNIGRDASPDLDRDVGPDVGKDVGHDGPGRDGNRDGNQDGPGRGGSPDGNYGRGGAYGTGGITGTPTIDVIEPEPLVTCRPGTFLKGTKVNFYQVTASRTLLKIEAFMNPAAGVELTWYVFESTAKTGPYEQIFSLITTATPNSSSSSNNQGYQSSGPIAVDLTAGRTYAIGVGWSVNAGYYYHTGGTVNVTFGTMIGGGMYDPPPNTSVTSPVPSTYYPQRLTTLPLLYQQQDGGLP